MASLPHGVVLNSRQGQSLVASLCEDVDAVTLCYKVGWPRNAHKPCKELLCCSSRSPVLTTMVPPLGCVAALSVNENNVNPYDLSSEITSCKLFNIEHK